MAEEQEGHSSKLRTIHIDLEERVIETLAQDGTVVRFTYNPEGIFQTLLLSGGLESAAQRLVTASQAEVAIPAAVEPVAQDASSPKEKSPALVLSGRLKNQPSEGRPDGHNKPTAVAQFLAHMADREGAALLFATFHNHTRDIALRLLAGDPITAQGYYHPNRNPDRLSTFSIFHLINHPGKSDQPKQQ